MRVSRWAPHVCRVLGCCLSVWVIAPTVLAHPALDEGLEFSAQLEVESALAKFDEALESGELTRDEVVRLVSERVLLLHALRRIEELAADLRWLAALKPGHILDMRAPPVLSSMWTTIRDQSLGVLAVNLVHSQAGGKLRVTATLSGTEPEGLRPLIHWRIRGEEWRTQDGQELLRPFVPETVVEFYAEVIGLGGVVAASHGTADAPLSLVIQGASEPVPAMVPAPSPVDTDDDDRARRLRLGLWIGGAAAVVVAGVVTGILLAGRDDDAGETAVMPMVTF